MLPKNIVAQFFLITCLAAAVTATRGQGNIGKSGAVADEITGVVLSSKGPEAGVWVVAQTTDLPTRFVKIVVTDEKGRYVLPDLPKANYAVWVRGYGLVDSQPVQSVPGKTINLKAVLAPNERVAAHYYPANYWYSLIRVPPASEFPGTGETGNGINPSITSQAAWISQLKRGCEVCHQMGTRVTRELPDYLRPYDSSVAAWNRRIQFGQFGGSTGISMQAQLNRFGRRQALAMFADWSDRIAAGEVPPPPPRPNRVERNVVITEWDWSDTKEFIHDVISTDKRNPTVNGYGKVFGTAHMNGGLVVVDPVRNIANYIKVPIIPGRDAGMQPFAPQELARPSPYWGDELVWTGAGRVHNPMMDQKGRVWFTAASRSPSNPDYCKAGSSLSSAQRFPIATSARQLGFYDPKTQHITLIDTCFTAQHLQFTSDPDNTLWLVGDSGALGWLKTRVFDETGDAVKAQGWCPYIVDNNGNGRADDYVEPGEPADPTKDRRLTGFAYGMIPDPLDASVWIAFPGPLPGRILRVDPKTCLTEVYEPPFNNPKASSSGFGPSGIDIDSTGVIWTALADSGHVASFDRRKCKVLNGPTATGQHCPEGWTLYPTPGPKFKGVVGEFNADVHYYVWVDQFDTFGLGKDVPIVTGTGSDSLLALLPKERKFVVLRVPYPLGFYQRGLDGRVDDSQGGWKGKGLWSSYGFMVPWHIEGGKGTTSKAVHFQLRPNPLAN